MGYITINSTRTPFINISDIVDSMSPNSASFTVELPNYSTANKLGDIIEVYGFSDNLLAVGNVRKETVKLGVRSRTSLEVVGYSAFLNWYPITGRFNGTLRNVITALITAAQLNAILTGVRFLTSDLAPEAIVSLSLSYQFLSQALQQVLALSGYPLSYRIPISEKIIEINQPGYGNPAPITDLNIADLYTNCGIGLQRPIQYNLVPPIASKIIVFGRHGLRNIGNGSVNPLDIVRYRSNGETQFKTLETADEIIKVLVTQPTPPIGDCNTVIVISGENYSQFDEILNYNFTFPDTSTDLVSLVYTADIENIKQSSNVSFYFDGSIDTVEGNITITFEGDEIFNQSLNADILSNTIVVSLRPYAGQSGEIIATVTLDAQPTTTTNYQGFLQVDCCSIITTVGTGVAGFNSDGLDRLDTDLYNPVKAIVDDEGNIYIADNLNYRVRKVDTVGTVTTIGGNGNAAITLPTDGGLATSQDFGQINDLVLVGTDLYILLPDWVQVAKIDLTNGNYYLVDDDFPLDGLTGLAADSSGNIYYSLFNSAVVYKLVSETTRTVYAGIFGDPGFTGDGGLATSAKLKFPAGLAFDADDNLYLGATIADGSSYIIRKVTTSDGNINTIAGNGSLTTFNIDAADYLTDDDHNPSISVDQTTGDVYFISEGVVLRITASDNKINRFAGISDAVGSGFSGDNGSPLTAVFDFFGSFFGGLFVKSATEIYFADTENNRVRKLICGDAPLTCMVLSWAATGIFTKLTDINSEAGFSVDATALGVGATGTFIATVELPANPTYFWAWLEYAFSDLAGTGTGGFIRVYIDGDLITSREIVEGNGAVQSGTSLFSYTGSTIELKFEYDGSTYSSSGFTGGFTYQPITVCPE